MSQSLHSVCNLQIEELYQSSMRHARVLNRVMQPGDGDFRLPASQLLYDFGYIFRVHNVRRHTIISRLIAVAFGGDLAGKFNSFCFHFDNLGKLAPKRPQFLRASSLC